MKKYLAWAFLLLAAAASGLEPDPRFDARMALDWRGGEKSKADPWRGKLDAKLGLFGFTGRFFTAPRFKAESSPFTRSMAGALYHDDTASRIIYGRIAEHGLPARLEAGTKGNFPFSSAGKNIDAILKTGHNSSQKDDRSLLVLLKSPTLENCDLSLLGKFDENKAWGSSFVYHFDRKTELAVETFGRFSHFEAEKSSRWLKVSNLPARKSLLWGLHTGWSAASWSFNADAALNQTSFYGRGGYISFSGHYEHKLPGPRPRVTGNSWRIDSAFDSSLGRWTNSKGKPNLGLRFAERFSYAWKYMARLSLETNFSSSRPGKALDHYRIKTHYQFLSGFFEDNFFRPRKMELGWSLDKRKSVHLHNLDTAFGMFLGRVWLKLHEKSTLTSNRSIQSLRFGAELRCNIQAWELGLNAAYYRKKQEKGEFPAGVQIFYNWELGTMLCGKAGFKLSSPRFPRDWAPSLHLQSDFYL
jgi:hypothetical protein